MRSKGAILIALLLLSLLEAAGQGAKPPVPPKVEPGTSLSVARAAVQKTVGTDKLPLWLKTYALALQPSDALSLCREFIPKSGTSDKASLASFASSLALVSGRIEDAAFFLAYPGKLKPDMLVDAVRCNLAIGRTEKAKTLLGQLPAELPPALADVATLASAWLSLMEGAPLKAYELVTPILLSGGKTAARREALFLAWLSQSSLPQGGSRADSIRADLERDFRESPEYFLVKGSIRPQPAAWLLEGLYPHGASLVASNRNLSTTAKTQVNAEDTLSRLQVGWFSKKENGQALAHVLMDKGFSATLDQQSSQDGEPRWAVIVAVAGDWGKVQAQLKDLGYESYLLP